MNAKTNSKIDEAMTIKNDAETKAAKTPKSALAGIKKGTAAARRTAKKVALAPAKIFDSAIYGACYGVSYGTVFSALMIAKVLPRKGQAMKGFHDGARFARKDFKVHEIKHSISDQAAVDS